MKTLRLLMRVIFLLTPSLLFAQAAVVSDITRTGVEIDNAAREINAMIDQTSSMMRLFNLSESQLKKWEDFKEKMDRVSDYVGSVDDIESFARSIDATYSLLKRGGDVILSDDWMDVGSKLSYFNSLLSMADGNIKQLEGMIERYSPGSRKAGNMNDAQRERLKIQEKERVDANMRFMKSKIGAYECQRAEEEEFRRNYSDATECMIFNY